MNMAQETRNVDYESSQTFWPTSGSQQIQNWCLFWHKES